MDTKMRFRKILDEVSKGYSIYKEARNQVSEFKETLEISKERMIVVDKARIYFQATAEKMQRDVAETLSVIITSAIRAVFDSDEYTCDIVFGTARNQSEARVVLYKGDQEIDDPMDSVGGGLIDVASFAARVGFIFLSGTRKVLIADEPFKGVSEDFRSKCPEMLRLLSEQLKMQFIINSHMPELIDGADNVIMIKNGSVLDV